MHDLGALGILGLLDQEEKYYLIMHVRRDYLLEDTLNKIN